MNQKIGICIQKNQFKLFLSCPEQPQSQTDSDKDTIVNQLPKDCTPFDLNEMVLFIAEAFLSYQDSLNLLSTNLNLRSLVAITRFQSTLRQIDLFPFDLAKFEFAQHFKFNFTINIKEGNDASRAMISIKNASNVEYLQKLEAIYFGDITSNNGLHISNFLKFIGPKCTSLKSLSCADIEEKETLNLTEDFSHLSSFSFGNIGPLAFLMCPLECNNLISLTIGDIAENAVISLPSELESLEYLALGKIHSSAEVVFPETLPNLKCIIFQKEDIENPQALAILYQFAIKNEQRSLEFMPDNDILIEQAHRRTEVRRALASEEGSLDGIKASRHLSIFNCELVLEKFQSEIEARAN